MANGHGGKRPGAGRKTNRHLDELQRALDAAVPYDKRVELLEILSAVGRSGNVQAIALLLAYLYGKPVERQEISGPDGEPIAVNQKLDALRELPPDELIRKYRQQIGEGAEGSATP